MKTLAHRFYDEPAYALGILQAALQAVQLLALDASAGVHVALGVVLAVLGAAGTRELVTPTGVGEPADPPGLAEQLT